MCCVHYTSLYSLYQNRDMQIEIAKLVYATAAPAAEGGGGTCPMQCPIAGDTNDFKVFIP